MKIRQINLGICILGVAMALGACLDSGGQNIRFPADPAIQAALQAQFANDPHSAAARELVRTLGGEGGELRYRVRHVLYRQGPFEARYDAVLHLGQPGARNLQQLYASMIPEAERTRLPAQDLAHYEEWLRQLAATLEKANPDQSRALRHTLEVLGPCYRDAPAGAEVVVMEGLSALLSPERKGLFAEKLPSDQAVLRCLPS